MNRGIRRLLLASISSLAVLAPAAPAFAQSDAEAAAIRAEIEAIQRDTDARVAEIQAETRARIAAIEARLGISASNAPAPVAVPTTTAPVATASSAVSAPAPASAARTKALAFSGDARIRYEQNFGGSRPERGREVVRARLRATYAVDPHLTFGARLVTGDPDDPNSADITLTQFDDDLVVALDQFYAKGSFGPLTLFAGKFDNPFTRNDLVWDGDVNPQGLAGLVATPLGKTAKLRLAAMHFIVDEAAAGPDSHMDGAQVGLAAKLGKGVDADVAAAYYHYDLPTLVGADAGDFRSNLVSGGRYVSLFHLVDLTGSLTWAGMGKRWPVRLVGDWVHNRGAAVPDDSGFSADLFVGRASSPRDWRVQYGYAEAGVDAVLAAFSHDNTDLATNYVQHTLGLDYVPIPHVLLNATLYHYRVRDDLYPATIAAHEWANRLRLHLTYMF
jgi:hypothetical protein